MTVLTILFLGPGNFGGIKSTRLLKLSVWEEGSQVEEQHLFNKPTTFLHFTLSKTPVPQ